MLLFKKLHILSTDNECIEYFEKMIQNTKTELNSLLVYFAEVYMGIDEETSDVVIARDSDV